MTHVLRRVLTKDVNRDKPSYESGLSKVKKPQGLKPKNWYG
jgi:hypothetical protein